jgi:hypothetical protein
MANGRGGATFSLGPVGGATLVCTITVFCSNVAQLLISPHAWRPMLTGPFMKTRMIMSMTFLGASRRARLMMSAARVGVHCTHGGVVIEVLHRGCVNVHTSANCSSVVLSGNLSVSASSIHSSRFVLLPTAVGSQPSAFAVVLSVTPHK